MSFDFTGKVGLVTGAATGIGAAAARRLAAGGAAVGLVGLQPELLAALAQEIVDKGGRALAVPTDVSDPAQVERAVAAVADEFGGLHLALNNAGVPGMRVLLHETTVEDWRHTLGVNLDGVYFAMKFELMRMVESGLGGAIVNIASVNATSPLGYQAAYTTSKHGVVGLSKTAALDYADKGIRINVVSPGVTDTPMVAAGGDAAERMTNVIPMGRMAAPDDIADAVLFALSDSSSYMTGAEIVVDGAFLLQVARYEPPAPDAADVR